MFYGESHLVEITSRTQHGRYLLRPSPETNAIILGVLGRAQRLYEVYLHAFIVLSNHFHLLMSVLSPIHMAGFTGYFKGNVAKELGRLHDWPETFWGRRYHHTEVTEGEEDEVRRFLYILQNGCKENLVGSPLEWPGVSSAGALYRGETTMQGVWYDRSAEYRARQPGKDAQFPSPETVYLTPMPFLRDRSPEQRRQWIVEAVDTIAAETAERHQQDDTKPLGVAAIQRRNPHDKPKKLEPSHAPHFHAANREVYRALQQARKAKIAAYREAAARLRRGETDVRFPEGCFPPPLPYVESRATT
jgi:hypothetical protein